MLARLWWVIMTVHMLKDAMFGRCQLPGFQFPITDLLQLVLVFCIPLSNYHIIELANW
jgi:hypothetical protein